MKKVKEKDPKKVWSDLAKKENLSDEQIKKIEMYANFLREWNQKINLTAITTFTGMARQHFQDSIVLRNFLDLNIIKTIADIGTGAGFPAIPLKIIFPHLNLILIEVNKKKQIFLHELIKVLELDNIEIVYFDWRTFLRKTEFDIDLFVTRAALDDHELCRMFRSNCFYRNKKLIYWGTNDWLPNVKNEKYLKEQYSYKLNRTERKLFVF
ncbi:16S rRNA (guanine(527)-N(7))-methyltransferase RsmG [Candidatus Dependentiae bacterium]